MVASLKSQNYTFSNSYSEMNTAVFLWNPGKKAWWKKSLVEKISVKRKPGGKKAWSILEKMEKKPDVFF